MELLRYSWSYSVLTVCKLISDSLFLIVFSEIAFFSHGLLFVAFIHESCFDDKTYIAKVKMPIEKWF